MPFSHIPLRPLPLVTNNIGVSKFWLHQPMSFGLSLTGLKPQAFTSQFPPLATVEQLTLGARTRTSIRRFANKRFLSDWNLEFPVIDLEPQDTQDTAAILPIGIERSEPLSEVVETALMEPSAHPATAELDPTEAPKLASPQLRSLHPKPTSRNQKTSSSNQKQRKPKKPSNRRIKQQQSHDIQLEKQIDDSQFITDGLNTNVLTTNVLIQDEQRERSQLEPWSQTHRTNKLHPIAETHASETTPQAEPSEVTLDSARNTSEAVLQTESSEVTLDLARKENSVESYAQKFSNPIQSEVNQTQQSQQLQEAINSAKPKHRQKASRKSSKQNTSKKKQTHLSKSDQISGAEWNNASEDQDSNLEIDKIEEVRLSTEKKIVDAKYQDIDHSATNEQNAIIKNKNNKQTKSTQSEFEQIDRSKASGEAEPLKTIIQPCRNQKLVNKVFTKSTPAHQIFESKNNQLEDSANIKTQQTETPVQGFSVGGQVKATTTRVPSIDPVDTVPAMLTPGEFVVNVTDAQKHLPLLHHINQGGSLEELTQTQAAKTSQVSELNSKQYEVDTSVPTHLQSSPRLGVHQPRVNSETETLQSGIFAEPQPDQSALYHPPELIFRSQQISNSSVPSSSSLSSASSINNWANVEELLQMTDVDASHSSTYHPEINSQVRSMPLSNELPVSETLVNSSHSSSLQSLTETDKQVSPDGDKNPNEAKTLEVVMDTLAQEIYSRLRQRLAIERERQGNFSGRLPW